MKINFIESKKCDFSYEDAEEILRTTLNMVTKMTQNSNETISPRWEPLLNNLGHCCRKNKKYDAALSYHQQVTEKC